MSFFFLRMPRKNHMPCPSARTKYFLSQAKKFIFAWEKDRKWLQAVEKFFSMAKKLFSIHFTSKNVLFSLGQNFLSGTNMFCLGQKSFCPVQKMFCPGRWTGHYSNCLEVETKFPIQTYSIAIFFLLSCNHKTWKLSENINYDNYLVRVICNMFCNFSWQKINFYTCIVMQSIDFTRITNLLHPKNPKKNTLCIPLTLRRIILRSKVP